MGWLVGLVQGVGMGTRASLNPMRVSHVYRGVWVSRL